MDESAVFTAWPQGQKDEVSAIDPQAEGACSHEGSAHDARRRQVLDAARKVFARQGFHSASMQTICAQARMSPGGLYRYFRSKDEIIAAIAEEQQHEANALMMSIEGEGPFLERVLKCGVSYLESLQDPDKMLLTAEVCAERLRNSHIGAMFHELECVVDRRLFKALQDAVAAGEIVPQVELHFVLLTMKALVDGFATVLADNPSIKPSDLEPILRRAMHGLLGERTPMPKIDKAIAEK